MSNLEESSLTIENHAAPGFNNSQMAVENLLEEEFIPDQTQITQIDPFHKRYIEAKKNLKLR